MHLLEYVVLTRLCRSGDVQHSQAGSEPQDLLMNDWNCSQPACRSTTKKPGAVENIRTPNFARTHHD